MMQHLTRKDGTAIAQGDIATFRHPALGTQSVQYVHPKGVVVCERTCVPDHERMRSVVEFSEPARV